MAAKKQQTFAKLQRERKVKERREMKQEKKRAADPPTTGVPSPPE